MKTLHNTDDLAALLTEPRALLFLWVNWAVHARRSRAVVVRLLEELDGAGHHIPCHVVDVSGQEGELWDALLNWLTAEGRQAEHLLYCGAGPLLWVQAGKVVLDITDPFSHPLPRLNGVTRSAFSIPNSLAPPPTLP